MISSVTYEVLDALAERFIPQNKHQSLHIYPRDMWVDFMVELIENGLIESRLSTLTKYATNWEVLLAYKLSIQN